MDGIKEGGYLVCGTACIHYAPHMCMIPLPSPPNRRCSDARNAGGVQWVQDCGIRGDERKDAVHARVSPCYDKAGVGRQICSSKRHLSGEGESVPADGCNSRR